METTRIRMDVSEAREAYEKYLGAIHYGDHVDREIMRAYRLLAQGKLVIKALESVKAAGLDAEGLPKLAITRADHRECYLRLRLDGSAEFKSKQNLPWRDRANRITFAAGTFQRERTTYPFWINANGGRSYYEVEARAVVPHIPANLKPKHGLSNYHILWEADWHAVPRDPYLLKRLGEGDLWLVVAMWDLTEVERAALAARI